MSFLKLVALSFFNQFILHAFYFQYLIDENQCISIHLPINLFFLYHFIVSGFFFLIAHFFSLFFKISYIFICSFLTYMSSTFMLLLCQFFNSQHQKLYLS